MEKWLAGTTQMWVTQRVDARTILAALAQAHEEVERLRFYAEFSPTSLTQAMDEIDQLRADLAALTQAQGMSEKWKWQYEDCGKAVELSQKNFRERGEVIDQLRADLAAITKDRDYWRNSADEYSAELRSAKDDLAASREREGRLQLEAAAWKEVTGAALTRLPRHEVEGLLKTIKAIMEAPDA